MELKARCSSMEFGLDKGGRKRRRRKRRKRKGRNFMLRIWHRLLRGSADSCKPNNQASTKHVAQLYELRIKDVARRTQKVNQILASSSSSSSFINGKNSIEIGKELLKQTLDLEASMRMLLSIGEEAEHTIHPYSRAQITMMDKHDTQEKEEEEEHNDKLLKYLAMNCSPKLSNLDAQTNFSGLGDKVSDQNQRRNPNLVAKLMGLEELPENKDPKSRKEDDKSLAFTTRNTESAIDRSCQSIEGEPRGKGKQQVIIKIGMKNMLHDRRTQTQNELQVATSERKEKQESKQMVEMWREGEGMKQKIQKGQSKEVRAFPQTSSRHEEHSETLNADNLRVVSCEDEEEPETIILQLNKRDQEQHRNDHVTDEEKLKNIIELDPLPGGRKLLVETANSVFDLNDALTIHDVQRQDVDEGQNRAIEILDCGHGKLKRKERRHSELGIQTKLASTDELIQEVHNDSQGLEHRKIGRSENATKDHLLRAIERDVRETATDAGCTSDNGWNAMAIAFREKYGAIIRDVERQVFKYLLHDLVRDLLPAC